MKQEQKLPLAGIRVVEFVHMVMGPTCGLVLADLGAEVIKIEPPDGDHTRHLTASGAGFFPTYNRNKKSLAVDLKSAAGREIVLKLLATADVVSENFRPGAMDKLGFGYAAVKKLKADIIYCSHKGFLPGPYEHRTALDEVVQMMGGLAYMTGGKGRPIRAGASVNDIMGGMFGAIAILSAIIQRKATGEGQYVQSGLFENNVFLMAQHMLEGFMTGKPVVPMPDRVRAWAVYDTFNTRDGQQVFVGVVTDTQWKVFCDEFNRPDLLTDPALLCTYLAGFATLFKGRWSIVTPPQDANPAAVERVAELWRRLGAADRVPVPGAGAPGGGGGFPALRHQRRPLGRGRGAHGALRRGGQCGGRGDGGRDDQRPDTPQALCPESEPTAERVLDRMKRFGD